MSYKIALAGNPNSGKTTLFNALTGSNQYVGNWPGVTVEKKEGKITDKDATIVDLPGIYSLSPYTTEEVVARSFLLDEKPDVIINIVDASNLERNLYLTTQLSELGIPMVIALNMMDVVEKNGDFICPQKLSEVTGCPVLELCALKNRGCKELVAAAMARAKSGTSHNIATFDKEIEQTVGQVAGVITGLVPSQRERFYAIKLLEGDTETQIALTESQAVEIQTARAALEKLRDDDTEGIFASARYDYIGEKTIKCHNKCNRYKVSLTDRIDKYAANKYLALPIFAMIMFAVYYISVSTVGTYATDWVNDVLFGQVITGGVESLLAVLGTAPWLTALVVDGIIGGVGAVLGFLPQMALLFFLLALLEDSGYMSRIAFILDRLFRRFGLSGKSFIPILIGTGCSVPGIMASRTIESETDRRMTVITTSFIPCSAKLPIIAMIAGAFFGGSALIALSAYLIGIGAILVSGIILKKTRGFSGHSAPFIMELPAYHMPVARNALRQMWDRVKAFAIKAGTIIFMASVIIWVLSNFNFRFQMTDSSTSMLSAIGGFMAPIFAPLGFGTWEASVATLTGLVAKESVVSTFSVLYGGVGEDGLQLWQTLRGMYTPLAGYSFLLFNLLCAPCIAALGAIKREMRGTGMTGIALTYQTGFAYVAAFIVYQIGLAFTQGVTVVTVIAALLVIGIMILLFKPNKHQHLGKGGINGHHHHHGHHRDSLHGQR